MNDSSTGASGQGGVSSPAGSQDQPRNVPLAILWALVIGVAGGFVVGQLIVKFGMLGGIGLWGAGALGGLVSRKITRAACRPVAWVLVADCVLAFCLAEVSWYHWTYDIHDEVTGEIRPQTWSESLVRAPVALWQRGQISLAVGVLFTIFGAQSAYWQAGKKYRLVAVAEE